MTSDHCWHGNTGLVQSVTGVHIRYETCCHCNARRTIKSIPTVPEGHGRFYPLVSDPSARREVIEGGEHPCIERGETSAGGNA